MKKILKGSVIISDGDTYYWVVEHIKGFIKVINMSGREQVLSESTASLSVVKDGKDAMPIIRKYFY